MYLSHNDENILEIRTGDVYKPGVNDWNIEHHDNDSVTIQNVKFKEFLESNANGEVYHKKGSGSDNQKWKHRSYKN